MKTIIIISALKDVHVEQMLKYVDNSKYKCLWIDPFNISGTNFISFDSQNPKVVWEGEEIDIENVCSLWVRKPWFNYHDALKLTKRKDSKTILKIKYNSNMEVVNYLKFLCKDKYCIDGANNVAANNKLIQMDIALKSGFKIPPTGVFSSKMEAYKFFERNSKELISKPVKYTTGDQISTSFTPFIVDEKDFEAMSENFDYFVLLQKLIRKVEEFRVTFVDGKMFTVGVRAKNAELPLDTRLDFEGKEFYPAEIPNETEESLRKYMKFFDMKFGAMDLMKSTEGDLLFLEVNPNGQYLMVDEILGFEISKAIAKVLQK